MAEVIIGVDPHKLSATIEVLDSHETVLATGRFGTDKAGYAAMRRHVGSYPDRTWAVEGSNGAGRPLAQRLLADGERVVDVPAKLSARARMFDTGHNRKTDPHDAHAVAVVAVRTKGLRVLVHDPRLKTLRLLVDRRAELPRARIQGVNRVHRLLSELGRSFVAGVPAPAGGMAASNATPPRTPSRSASPKARGGGSSVRVRTFANSWAMRLAAASRKWPEPAAGSSTLISSKACSRASGVTAASSRSSMTGTRALFTNSRTSSAGV